MTPSPLHVNHSLRVFMIGTTLIITAALAACGGGGDGDGGGGGSNVPPPPPPPAAVQNGFIKDLNVGGLGFASGAQAGTTDINGGFSCETGADVAFSIGGVNLGQTACATLVTPNQLATDDANFDLELANLSRFLQMLDVDGDPDNGLLISDMVQQVAANWQQVDFLTADLANELVTIIADAVSVDGTLHTLPSEVDALSHLLETLQCSYAGAYAGSVSGSNSAAAGMVIGWAAVGFGFRPFGFEWQAIDAPNEFFEFGGGDGSITVRVLPSIDHDDPGFAGPINVQFTTPDDISGTWQGGTVTLHRIGADNGGEYRFVGKATSAETAAYISLNFSRGVLNGEAFDVVEGTTFEVTGTIDDNTNAVSLTASGGGETLSGVGTLDILPDGSPGEINGTFDGGISFNMAACRLNSGQRV